MSPVSGFSTPSTRRLLHGVPVAAAVASTASRRRIDGVDGVEARARELRANNRVASTALASTPSHAMIQNEDAHPPRAQAHAARAGSD